MKARFAKVAKELEQNEEKIVEELLAAQGDAVDLGGYYVFDEQRANEVMRPSPTLNAIIDAM
jgi:isocitrate dehydrogenase